ncbi:PhzF family phenazine biosynthesis protein [Gemmobacter lanyuensis]
MLAFHTLDVFTDTAFTGNPLAVVLGADALTTAQMQIIAREFNLSETIFVQAPAQPGHRARVRIFLPGAEIPFAGHPTLGCAILLAEEDHPAGDFDTVLVLEEEAGLVPVRVTRRGDVTEAEFTAPVLPHAFAGSAPPALVAKALDLAEDEVGFGAHRPALWQGAGLPVRAGGGSGLPRPRPPDGTALVRSARGGGVDSAYLYTPAPTAISARGCTGPARACQKTRQPDRPAPFWPRNCRPRAI